MERVKGELEVRRRVERLLRRRIPDELWRKLDPEELIEPVVNHAQSAQEELLDELRVMLVGFDIGRSAGSGPRHRIKRRSSLASPALVMPQENRIGELCAAEIVRQATAHVFVQNFRAMHLCGKTVAPEHATRILSVPAPRLLPEDRYRELGLSLADDRTELAGEAVRLEPNRPMYEFSILNRAARGRELESGEIPYRWLKRIPLPPAMAKSKADEDRTIQYAPHSIVSHLVRVAESVARPCIWDLGDAIWFILTGKPPSMPAMYGETHQRRFGGHTDARITLVIRHWVSPQSVERFYRDLQGSMLKKRFRPLASAQIEKVAFVERRTHPDGHRPQWTVLYREWCRAKNRKVDDNWRTFARDCARARAAMMPPRFPLMRRGLDKDQVRKLDEFDEGVRLLLRSVRPAGPPRGTSKKAARRHVSSGRT